MALIPAATAQQTLNNMNYKSETLVTIMSSNSNPRPSLNLENSWVSNQAITYHWIAYSLAKSNHFDMSLCCLFEHLFKDRLKQDNKEA